METLRIGGLRIRLRSHVVANGRNSSLYPAVTRLLAVAQNQIQPGNARALAIFAMEALP